MEGGLIYSNQTGGEEVAPDFPTPQEECKAPPQDPTVHLESLTGHCPHVLMDYLSFLLDLSIGGPYYLHRAWHIAGILLLSK